MKELDNSNNKNVKTIIVFDADNQKFMSLVITVEIKYDDDDDDGGDDESNYFE